MTQHNQSEGERFYDQEVGPVLKVLAEKCREHGMSLIANVEYEPNRRAATYSMCESAGLEMQMVRMCSLSAPNLDSYLMNLYKFTSDRGISVDGSFVMRMLVGEIRP